MFEEITGPLRKAFDKSLSINVLRAAIIGWAVFIVFLALHIDNKYHLAGMLAWELLP